MGIYSYGTKMTECSGAATELLRSQLQTAASLPSLHSEPAETTGLVVILRLSEETFLMNPLYPTMYANSSHSDPPSFPLLQPYSM